MKKEEAIRQFRHLVSRHGHQWGSSVPASAHDTLRRINQVLSADDRRAAILAGR